MLAEADLGGVLVGDGHPVRVVGALNVSPESFYRGSVAENADRLIEMAGRMVDEGADIIDVGGMSTAPYLDARVPMEEERRRVVEAISALAGSIEVPISVDTQRAPVARAALEAGARIVNDVSGLTGDPGMAPLIAEYGASAIVCAHGRVSDPSDPIWEIRRLLRKSLRLAELAGVPMGRIVVDPAVGFFRDTGVPWYQWDARVISELGRLAPLGRPILVGPSRKSFIGAIAGVERPEDRLPGSLAAAAVAVVTGAHAVRVHDVAETVQAVRMAEALRRKRKTARSGRCEGVELRGLLERDLREVMVDMGVHPGGAELMARKGVGRVLLIRNLSNPVAQILKQEALSAGGDVATPAESLVGGPDLRVDVLVLANDRQLDRVVQKLSLMASQQWSFSSEIGDLVKVIEELREG